MNIIASSRDRKNMKLSLIDYLPNDMLHEIFLRLPCKDIVVYKTVCKTWYDLISHRIFSRDYANNSPYTSIFLFHHAPRVGTSSALLLEVAPDGGAIKTLFRATVPGFYADPCLPEKHKTFIIGSCNGLVFFGQTTTIDLSHKVETVYSYNPLSGDCVLLAEHESSCPWRVQYRIGYVPSSDAIKLVMLVKDRESARILTVGIDRGWRRLPEGGLDYHLENDGVTFNDKLHWIGLDYYNHVENENDGETFNDDLHWIHRNLFPEDSIFSRYSFDNPLKTFDFEKERMGAEWKLPARFSQQRTWMTMLAVVKNRLTVIEITRNQEMVVHTMEEYGVAQSWSEKKTIIRDHIWDPSRLIAASADGGILFSDRDILFSDRSGTRIKMINPEKEDDVEIDVSDDVSDIGILYGVEFSPRFYGRPN